MHQEVRTVDLRFTDCVDSQRVKVSFGQKDKIRGLCQKDKDHCGAVMYAYTQKWMSWSPGASWEM